MLSRFLMMFLRLTLLLIVAFGFSVAQVSAAVPVPPSFADLAEKLTPTVVNISTTHSASSANANWLSPLPPEPQSSDRMQNITNSQHSLGNSDKPASLGSGVIIDPAGFIVTNYHVIQNAKEIMVSLQNDNNLKARLVGYDKKTDLALLKINAKSPLPTASWGDSDKMRVGDWIIAIGDPYGLGGSVTAGIISARARDINSGPYDDYLQTDAPINRGNSGGPMFDMDGKIVGINTAIFSPSGGSIGISFAIPSAIAKNIIDQLRTNGVVKRGWIGVYLQDISPEIAEAMNLADRRGALVTHITPDSPAEKSGLMAGDIILSFGNRAVVTMHNLPRFIASSENGTTLDISILRQGKPMTLKITIGALADQDAVATDDISSNDSDLEEPVVESTKIDDLGITTASLNETLRNYYHISKDTGGILITSVIPNGMGDDRELQIGDIIVNANATPLLTPSDLNKHIARAKKEDIHLLLLINHDGDWRYISFKLKKP